MTKRLQAVKDECAERVQKRKAQGGAKTSGRLLLDEPEL
jgi:hypothetical protein